MHVDQFIDDPNGNPYARWVLMHFRLPAVLKCSFHEFVKERKLFCTYNGERYRVIGASRLGDVWLTKDFDQDNTYDLRVDVEQCSDWWPDAD